MFNSNWVSKEKQQICLKTNVSLCWWAACCKIHVFLLCARSLSPLCSWNSLTSFRFESEKIKFHFGSAFLLYRFHIKSFWIFITKKTILIFFFVPCFFPFTVCFSFSVFVCLMLLLLFSPVSYLCIWDIESSIDIRFFLCLIKFSWLNRIYNLCFLCA